MEGVGASVIDRVVGLLFTRITKELGYWVCSGNKVKAMKKEMVKLDEAAEIIEKKKEDINDVKDIESSVDVSIWLKQFEDIRNEAAKVPIDGIGIGCFNIKMRYKAGKQSAYILENIKSRLKDIPHYESTGGKILAKVPSKYQASTSGTTDDDTQNNFETRDVIFKKALECLESKRSKTQMIALCGMGGVGKSHMMDRLKKKVEESRLFYWVVKVVVGQNIDLNALQHALAEKTGGALEETTSDARAERLKNRFAEMSKDGEKKILLILDDLWEEVNLQDIGLTNHLPNGYKLLITSRKTNVCIKMGVHTDAISNIGALSDGEAITLFFDEAEIIRDNDPNLDRIIDEIIKRCGKLPIALKLIASTLRGKSTKEAACKVALLHLQRHELKEHYEIVHKAFEISYKDLKSKEEKSLFLLSGLFPDDFDIPVEELIWFGWGLKLFSVTTFAEARLQVEIWVESLISANLLAKSDRVGCIKMHDLARTFALSGSIEVKQASIVNNHDILKQRTHPELFQRILLKCSGMSDFPRGFDYSDIEFLKLMDGDEKFKFPADFYRSIEKLKVLSYEGIHHPLLPKSTNVTTLCLHGCKFTYDWSAIKNLVQLEVLSFAGSGITELPCEVGELKNLKLLDLTGCSAELCIGDGVLEGLCSLEELYIKASGHKAISFTKDICEELKVLSAKLSALQVELFDKETLPENMSFTKLERFKISIGCLLEEDKDIYSFKNTLKLVTSSTELNKWKINELFEKTENLHLQVKDMKNLKDVIFFPSQPCFFKLTELEVSDCEELTFLFPDDVARAFMTLERLKVSSCRVLETLIHGESGGVIEFRKLKYVSLKELPQLTSLCDMDNRVELQQLVELTLHDLPGVTSIYPDNGKQSFFNPQAQIPELEELRISSMEKLMQIWPCEKIATSTKLIELEVSACASLTFLFPAEVGSALTKLEHLTVSSCRVLKTLIHGESGEQGSVIKFPKLKFLTLKELPRLMSLCDTHNRVELQELVELRLDDLPSITSIYPDSGKQSFFNPQVEIPMLEKLKIYSMKNLVQIWNCQTSTGNVEIVSTVRVVEVKGCDSLVNLFPTNPMPMLNKLEELQVKECGSIDVLFNIDLVTPPNPGPVHFVCGCWPWDRSVELVTPPEENTNSGCVGKFEEVICSLRSIRVEKLGKLEVLWRINGASDSPFLSCFQSVENIHIHGCKRFSNISTPTIPNFPPGAHVDIRIQDSRDLVFNKALKSLDPDSKTAKIALCGVGNAGKTTLMEDLVEAVNDLRMFHSIVKLVIGRESNTFDLQETTAKGIDEVLKERTIKERAERLRRIFMQKSQGVKSKILVILDGLWKEMDLEDIGLQDPLPNGMKLLITSRNENVCSQMGVEKSSIFRVPLLEGPEAKVLFYQTLRPSDGDAAGDPKLQKIAEDVVKICCGRAYLVKEIASYLTRHEARSTWEDSYFNFKKNHLNAIYQKWYEQLETEDAKAVLLLSGSFPEEADIRVEDLVRYGWGLKLFNDEVVTLAEARQRITNSVDELIHANMMIRSKVVGFVRMNHPLRGFVFSDLTTVKQALIKYDYTPKDAEEPYERILLNCTGMSELPVGFNYQNLRLVKLMGEKEQLKLPHEFYDRMKNLEVVAYEKIVDPLLPSYSANLRTLCLDACSLGDDFSFLGDLVNLEILSFARCGMKKLPSTIGKLRKLKLLDVTGCSHDLSIEDGVFRNLVNLEELYMVAENRGRIWLTDSNYEELEILFKQLCALEFVFYDPKDGSFEKLEKFKISVGCKLDEDIELKNSENILRLVSNRNEVVEWKMNVLFEKTEILYLKVKDMKTLEEVSMQYAFCNLRELKVCDCRDLTFLFTVPVADGLRKLESLEVSRCRVLETLIRDESGGGGSVIMFPKLKFLKLKRLPRLMSLCDTDNSVELLQLEELILVDLPNFTSIYPDESMQSLFNQQVQIPNLEELRIYGMEKLMQIWPCEEQVNNNNNNNVSMLRFIEVVHCASLVNLFPRNPLPLLNHLEVVRIWDCGSIEVIFRMELRGGNINEHTSSLKEISVGCSEGVREIWRIEEGGGGNNNVDSSSPLLITCFQAVKEIQVRECKRFRDITFSPKNINFDIRASVNVWRLGKKWEMDAIRRLTENIQEQIIRFD